MTNYYLYEYETGLFDSHTDEMDEVFESRNLNLIEQFVKSGTYATYSVLNVTWRDDDELAIRHGRDLLAKAMTFEELRSCEFYREQYDRRNKEILEQEEGPELLRLEAERKKYRDLIRKDCKTERLKAELEFRTDVLLIIVKHGEALESHNACGIGEMLLDDDYRLFRAILASEIGYKTWIEIAKIVVGEIRLLDKETGEVVLNDIPDSLALAKMCLKYIVNPDDEHAALMGKLKKMIEVAPAAIGVPEGVDVDLLRKYIPDFESTKYWKWHKTGAGGRCVREIIDITLALVASSLKTYEILWIIQQALPECTSDDAQARPRLTRFQVVEKIENIVKRYRESQEKKLLREQQKISKSQ